MDRKRLQKALKIFASPKVITRTDDAVISVSDNRGAREKTYKLAAADINLLSRHKFIKRYDKGSVKRLVLSDLGQITLKRLLAINDFFNAQRKMVVKGRIADPGDDQLPGNNGQLKVANISSAESPVSWLRRHKGKDGQPMLSPEQFAAGEKLRRDYAFAGMMPSITGNWFDSNRGEQVCRSGPVELSDDMIAARAAVNEAIEAVGSELASIMIDICCFLKGLGQVEQERGWPRSSAKIVLRLALSRLASHYDFNENSTKLKCASTVADKTANYDTHPNQV